MTTAASPALAARRAVGWTELRVSPLALGTMQFGWSVTDVGAFDLLDRYREAGGNLIDTADMYGPDQRRRTFDHARHHVGVSEDVIGRWMAARRCRDELVVATKVRAPMWDGEDGEGLSRQHIERAVEDSLRRLRVETIDLYQAHWPDDETPVEETFEVFGRLVASGKVRYVGTSNYALGGELERAASLWGQDGRYARLACEQLRVSLVNCAEFEQAVRPVAVDHDLGVLCYSPLAAGFLSGKYRSAADLEAAARGRFLAQYAVPGGWAVVDALVETAAHHEVCPAAVALAWLLADDRITAPIAGANSIEQLESWLPAGTLSLESDEVERLSALSWRSSQIEFSSW